MQLVGNDSYFRPPPLETGDRMWETKAKGEIRGWSGVGERRRGDSSVVQEILNNFLSVINRD